ncbi:hypothetical protein IKG29_00910 [Candidatus Saccharibacteria bacterium]|nr:hypothetical protein [Candidatus Saccharibacteria bacterium]
MKKTQKKAFGLLGLLLVVAVTIFAAIIPEPEASAVSSVTDTVEVRVVGNGPHVEFTNPEDGSVFVTPEHSVPYIYDGAETVIIKIEYIDTDGNPHEYTLDTIDADFSTGSGTIDLDLSGPGYGYGDYVITITGEREGDFPSEDSFSFTYSPVVASLEEESGDDNATLNLYYDDDSEEIDYFEIIIYDENGDEVARIPAINVTPPIETVILPFADNEVPGGTYYISVIAYNEDDEALFEPFWLTYVYEPKSEPTPTPTPKPEPDSESDSIVVPNTGGLMGGLNISRSDFLITGLIIFFFVGIGGILFTVKGRRKK